MLAEAALAIGARVVARSVLLTAFGFDSVVELISALVLLWRLRVEASGATAERTGRVEGRAGWLSAVCSVSSASTCWSPRRSAC